MPFLDWVNKAQAVNIAADVPYHLLQQQSFHGNFDSDNILIQGDNLLALKALLPFYRGKVKCIYIDPPYNTQSAFTHYDDKLEHSQWLTLMYPRLVMLRELLAEDGSIWVSIDDREAHYLKVLMDEVFGRGNFVANVVWQKRISPDNRLRLGGAHDHIIVFAKSPMMQQSFNQLDISESRKKDFKNPDKDPRGAWASTDCTAQAGHATDNQFYKLTTPVGRVIELPNNLCWRFTKIRMEEEISAGRIWFGKDGTGVPRKKTYLSEINGQNAWTWWTNAEVGHNQEGKKEINSLFGGDNSFDTPKPERLLERILHIATNPGDLVLDSFLGSGTTAAVAHKMGRRWIGIEMGEHALTHCLPRMEKVIAGEQGGISKAVNWQGGGGFRFHTLGEPVFDANGAINPNVRFAALAGYLWHFETGEPWERSQATHPDPPLSGRETVNDEISSNNPPLIRGVRGVAFCLTPLLGIHNNTAYYLLYNGILGDRRPQGGNVLTSAVLAYLDEAFPHSGARVIYGETTRLGEVRLRESGITFKQIPYDIKAR